jgi:hypothetical protein
MRRSGTTILFDAFCEDPELRCFYEPFREEDETPGGGSGARDRDLFAETRDLRREFRRKHRPEVPLALFNHGGPRAPALELHPGMPQWGVDFLGYLLDQDENVLIKNVRMYRKVPILHAVDPSAVFVHVVRDPRAVSASMMLGRHRRQLARYEDADAFFKSWSRRRLWSSRAIADAILEAGEHPALADGVPDFMRPMVVWKAAFDGPFRDGGTLFANRYVLVRLEDLRADPAGALIRIYDRLERRLPDAVASWAERNVRRENEITFADDPRWAAAAEALDMTEALEAAGYGHDWTEATPTTALALDPPATDEPSSRLSGAITRARRGVGKASGRRRR